MTEPEGCYTLSAAGREEIIIRKSHFIGLAAPVKSEEEALALIHTEKSSYRDASHHCFAYIIGENAGLMRFSDDKEPQGTAGIPILEVLRRTRLVNCAAVVTRYFGGVLLGTGGLARAYTQAASLAVKNAGVALSLRSIRITAEIPYVYWDRINYALERLPVCGIQREFSSFVTLTLTLRETDREALERELAALTDGNVTLECSESFYWLWQAGQDV